MKVRITEEEIVRLLAVADAARAEVEAQGYRSTDMAIALDALYGRGWYVTGVDNDD